MVANIRLRWKWMRVKKQVIYNSEALFTVVKSFTVDATAFDHFLFHPWRPNFVQKTFQAKSYKS
jgi:hypothetical protein